MVNDETNIPEIRIDLIDILHLFLWIKRSIFSYFPIVFIQVKVIKSK